MVFFRRKGFDSYRRHFAHEEEANTDCEAFNEKLMIEGRDGLHIGPREREQIKTALLILEGTGILLVRAAEVPRGRAMETQAALWEFLEAKERQGRAERTIYNLKSRLEGFIEFTGANTLKDLNADNCEHYIYRGTPNQQRNNYAALNNFAGFCVRKGYMPSNPLMRIEKPGAPGRRQQSDLHGQAAGGKMRGRKRRFVPIRKGLQSYLDAYGWKVPTAFWQRECRSLSPVPWENDICRHTGISFRLAESGDEKKTAEEAGNSIDTMYAYYHEPKTKTEARVFGAISSP